jgi:hypothetical protein
MAAGGSDIVIYAGMRFTKLHFCDLKRLFEQRARARQPAPDLPLFLCMKFCYKKVVPRGPDFCPY